MIRVTNINFPLNSINLSSRAKVMRINKMITIGRSVWSYWKWILGLKVLKQFGNNIAPVFTVTNIKNYSIKGI